MSVKTRTTRFRDMPRNYAGLVAIHVPRPVRDQVELENVTEIVDLLAGHKLTRDQSDYLDILSDAIEKYEAEHSPLNTKGITTVDVLNYLLDIHGMSASDLGRVLGERSLGSKVLSGERELSKKHIAVLCEVFKVSADLFI